MSMPKITGIDLNLIHSFSIVLIKARKNQTVRRVGLPIDVAVRITVVSECGEIFFFLIYRVQTRRCSEWCVCVCRNDTIAKTVKYGNAGVGRPPGTFFRPTGSFFGLLLIDSARRFFAAAKNVCGPHGFLIHSSPIPCQALPKYFMPVSARSDSSTLLADDDGEYAYVYYTSPSRKMLINRYGYAIDRPAWRRRDSGRIVDVKEISYRSQNEI